MFFFFNDTATTEIYTLSLHDALPILRANALTLGQLLMVMSYLNQLYVPLKTVSRKAASLRSEEHTSELQSQSNLVCRLLLEKKKVHTEHYSHEPSRIPAR